MLILAKKKINVKAMLISDKGFRAKIVIEIEKVIS